MSKIQLSTSTIYITSGHRQRVSDFSAALVAFSSLSSVRDPSGSASKRFIFTSRPASGAESAGGISETGVSIQLYTYMYTVRARVPSLRHWKRESHDGSMRPIKQLRGSFYGRNVIGARAWRRTRGWAKHGESVGAEGRANNKTRFSAKTRENSRRTERCLSLNLPETRIDSRRVIITVVPSRRHFEIARSLKFLMESTSRLSIRRGDLNSNRRAFAADG